MGMTELKNEFSWSWSRHRTFQECLRKYWLQHYGFWLGWDASGDPEVREIYIQKRLATRPQWIGTTIHSGVEWVLSEVRRGSFPPPRQLIERVRWRARRTLEDSRRGLFRLNPKKFPGFVDHYYESDPGDEVWDEALSEIDRQLMGLFDNGVFLRLTEVPQRIREIEELAQVRVGDVPVWVSLDVLVDDGQGGLVIIDWKTGRRHDPDTVSAQLGVYGVYVLDSYFNQRSSGAGLHSVERIKTMYVNLRSAEHHVFKLKEADIQTAVETIRASAAQMQSRLTDVPENIADKDQFPMLPEGAPACTRCRFRRSCDRG